jgi:phosphoribosylglycinamide formyltransferase-1
MEKIRKIAVLVSGGGSNLQALIDAQQAGELGGGQIALVIADRPAYGLERAQKAGIEALLLDKKSFESAAAFNGALLQALKERQIEAVVLAGYLSIVDGALVRHFPNRILNIHPSLIPAFCGMGFHGHHVHESVIARGCKLSGCTVHFVNEGADEGPIIAQQAVEVLPEDTAETLAARILPWEHRLLPRCAALLCAGRLRVEGRKVFIEE